MPQYERPAHSRLLEMRLESKHGSKKKKKHNTATQWLHSLCMRSQLHYQIQTSTEQTTMQLPVDQGPWL